MARLPPLRALINLWLPLVPTVSVDRTAPSAGWGDLFRHRRFVLYLATLSVGDIGYSVYAVAAPWLAYQVTHNFVDVGAVLAAEFGLYAFSFIAAPFVDRAQEKRIVLLWGYALQAVAASSIGVLAIEQKLTFLLLLPLVSMISLVWDFTWSANNTIPPLLLPKEALFRASGLSGVLSGGNQVTGFTVGGALILLTGPGGAMLLYGALNAASAVLALGITTQGSPSAQGPVWQTMVEGWHAWWGGSNGRPLRSLSLLVAVQGFFAPGSVLLITSIASRAAASQFTYGVLFTAFVLGGAAIGILLGHFNPRRHVGLLLLTTPLIAAGLLASAAWAEKVLALGVVLWFASGTAMLGFEVCYLVYLQATSPPSEVARTTSNVFFFRGTARATGAIALGFVATFLLPTTLALWIAGGLVVSSVVGAALWPSLRKVQF
ncbi:MAG: hypothetical protein KGI98_07015 [Euryarchaeota archaeon]|nr:hypothetical protein [Euryarchaeota archaeon]MDE1881721.1 hypothetical protein [Euryarchaeota archaeon]